MICKHLRHSSAGTRKNTSPHPAYPRLRLLNWAASRASAVVGAKFGVLDLPLDWLLAIRRIRPS